MSDIHAECRTFFMDWIEGIVLTNAEKYAILYIVY